MVSFQQCDESCGWIAAGVAIVAFGSFGVPFKSSPPGAVSATTNHHHHKPAMNLIHHQTSMIVATTTATNTSTTPPPSSSSAAATVHPLVLQTYKTTMCFVTCWLILLFDIPYQFSYYGLASGLFWVPGGIAGIYGIRNAGLAVAVGTWSSIIVMTSFVFGIIIFQEKVKNIYHATMSFTLLTMGLIGMARFSSTASSSSSTGNGVVAAIIAPTTTSKPNASPVNNNNYGNSSLIGLLSPRATSKKKMTNAPVKRNSSFGNNKDDSSIKPLLVVQQPLEVEVIEDHILDDSCNDKQLRRDVVTLCNNKMELTTRQLGILGAVFNGAWGGLNLIPLHYAAKQNVALKGAGYLISYATGSMIINIGIWLCWYLYEVLLRMVSSSSASHNKKKGGSTSSSSLAALLCEAYEALPSLQLPIWGIPGCCAGLLYSIGNFASILAVTALGQSTGFSVCMMQLFVSGLWGVLYFGEIHGFWTAILPWFISAMIAVTGIIGLSYQRQSAGE